MKSVMVFVESMDYIIFVDIDLVFKFNTILNKVDKFLHFLAE